MQLTYMRDNGGIVEHVAASLNGRLDVFEHGGVSVGVFEEEVESEIHVQAFNQHSLQLGKALLVLLDHEIRSDICLC